MLFIVSFGRQSGLLRKHRAGRHFAEVDFMLRRATWQGDYRPSIGSPSPLRAIEMALKRLERFERFERLERAWLVYTRRDQEENGWRAASVVS
jgi:hypothetical protein